MNNTITKTITHVICPNCSHAAGTIDHVIDKSSSYRWYCDTCQYEYSFTMRDRNVVGPVLTGNKNIPITVLVLIGDTTASKPTYAMFKHFVYHAPVKQNGYTKENVEFIKSWIEGHTCPINILSGLDQIYYDGEPDNHDLLTFVGIREGHVAYEERDSVIRAMVMEHTRQMQEIKHILDAMSCVSQNAADAEVKKNFIRRNISALNTDIVYRMKFDSIMESEEHGMDPDVNITPTSFCFNDYIDTYVIERI